MQEQLDTFLGISGRSKDRLDHLQDLESIDWSFRTANVKEHVHGLHPYPARMVPQMVELLIKIFSREVAKNIGNVDWGIYDPFCGSGTVLTEGRKLGFNVIGTDINPLAILIANVKSNPLNKKHITPVWQNLKKNYRKTWQLKEYHSIPDPEIPRLEFWFKRDVINQLKTIKFHLNRLQEVNVDKEVINFFKVCFSITVRKVSNNRQGEFKIYRLNKEDLLKWNPNVFKFFETRVEDSIKRVHQYLLISNKKGSAKAYLHNSKNFKPKTPIGLIITSPPYGDHQTTVAYGQFSRYPALWLGLDENKVMQVDRDGLGGVGNKNITDQIDLDYFGSPTLTNVAIKIQQGDQLANKKKQERENEKALAENREPKIVKSPARIHSVLAFFADYYQVLENLFDILLEGGYACFVTGNRTVRSFRIPTHQITKEFCEKIGFTHYKTLERVIPTKTMPWENSPTNIIGDRVQTMATEHIIIVKK